MLQVSFSMVRLQACVQQLSVISQMSLVTSAQGSSITQKVPFSKAGMHEKKQHKMHIHSLMLPLYVLTVVFLSFVHSPFLSSFHLFLHLLSATPFICFNLLCLPHFFPF